MLYIIFPTPKAEDIVEHGNEHHNPNFEQELDFDIRIALETSYNPSIANPFITLGSLLVVLDDYEPSLDPDIRIALETANNPGIANPFATETDIVKVHNDLSERDANDVHPVDSITDAIKILDVTAAISNHADIPNAHGDWEPSLDPDIRIALETANDPGIANQFITMQDMDSLYDALTTIETEIETDETYTLLLTDNNKMKDMENSNPQTVIIPLFESVALPTGASIMVRQVGDGQVTIAPEAGVTIQSPDNSLATYAKYSRLGLIKVAVDIWSLDGGLE